MSADRNAFVQVVSQIDAGKHDHSHAAFSIHGEDFGVRTLAEELHGVGQAEVPHLGLEFRPQFAVAGQDQLALDPPLAQQSNGLDEIAVAFDRIQIRRAEDGVPGPGEEGISASEGRLTPRCITTALRGSGGAPSDAAIRHPLWEMKRTKLA